MAKGFLDGYKTYDSTNGFGNAKKWRDALQERMSKEQAQALVDGLHETPYTILGIPAGATEAQIKKAFRQLITEWHPDRNQHRLQEAGEMSQRIIAAYTVLTR